MQRQLCATLAERLEGEVRVRSSSTLQVYRLTTSPRGGERLRDMMKRLTAAVLAATIATFSVSSTAQADPYLQCVAFARMITGIQIFGDAWTWWSKALGKYADRQDPGSGRGPFSVQAPHRAHAPRPRGGGQPGPDRPHRPDHPRQLEPPYKGSRRQGRARRHRRGRVRTPATGAWSRSGTTRSATWGPRSIRPTASSIRRPRTARP